jgi:hypothetical protein
MTTAVTKASKLVKDNTSTVRHHLNAVERAREIYLAQIKRAEADYFERIKLATALVTGSDDGIAEAASSQQAAPTQETPPTDAMPPVSS